MLAQSVQTFGRKKTAVAVAYCKRGSGLIKLNGAAAPRRSPLVPLLPFSIVGVGGEQPAALAFSQDCIETKHSLFHEAIAAALSSLQRLHWQLAEVAQLRPG